MYVDLLGGKTPYLVDALLRARVVHHSAVALAELTHLFGRLEPDHPGTPGILAQISGVLDDIPARRLASASTTVLAEAGMLAGLTARLAGRTHDIQLLNDATLFLQARESGRALLTRNVADFDLFDQLMPGSQLLLYRVLH